jgi:hypothetical protein
MSTALLRESSSSRISRPEALDESQRQVEERVGSFDDLGADFTFLREFDIEIDYDYTTFQVEGDVSVHVADPQRSPIRLGYHGGEEATLEVIDWGLIVPLEQSTELPRLIGRRFLELYSKAVTGFLREEEREWLRKISEQMDYHSFAAARKLPRYREATLVRKSPVLQVQFIEDRNIKLDTRLTSKLVSIEPGERFGAWFRLGDDGEVTDFEHVLLLPGLDDILSELPMAAEGIEFPESLASLLPKAE